MHLPAPLRAAVGLVATAADEAKHLPDRAIELPMLAVSTALQMSLRAQQRYARLAERGDAVLNGREIRDDPPEWATFDDPVEPPSGRRNGSDVTPGEAARASRLVTDLFGTDTPTLNGVPVGTADDEAAEREPAHTSAPKKAATNKTASKKTASKKAAPKKAATRKTTSAAGGKSVPKPRNGAPSRFDSVADD